MLPNLISLDEVKIICKSLQGHDHSEVVMEVFEKLKHASLESGLETKSEEKSYDYRRQGNDSFKSRRYLEAQRLYNMALCYAPNNSRSLKLAYSNRSALLYEIKAFGDALKDIKMCHQLGCPDDLVQKLKIREEKCHQVIPRHFYGEALLKKLISSTGILSMGTHRSDEIPCVSRVVKSDTSGALTRVVAAEDINVGTVIAIETAFVQTCLVSEDANVTCYHCMKPSFNLIPCNDCCFAMFCDETCMKMAFDEYHAVECKLLHKGSNYVYNLALKFVIKTKFNCGNWKNFIEACNNTDKYEKFSTHTNPFSLLHNVKDTDITFDKESNGVKNAAILIRLLEHTACYFPSEQNEKLLAMRATAKLLMSFLLYSERLTLSQTTLNFPDAIVSESYSSNGYYIFLSKLEHSCQPNLFVKLMNNKAVITAIQPIPRGTPLTISYIGHYLLHQPLYRSVLMFEKWDTVCSCRVCTEKWGEIFMKNYKLSSAQEKSLKEIDFEKLDFLCIDHGYDVIYKKICFGLQLFMDLPNTLEYKKFCIAFLRLLQLFCFAETQGSAIVCT